MWVVSVLGGGWWAAYNAGSGRPEYLKAAPRSALAICFKQTTLTTTGSHSHEPRIVCPQRRKLSHVSLFGINNIQIELLLIILRKG